MTKQEFLAELAQALYSLPTNEQRDILRDYEEYFIDAQSAGRSDAEVIEMLGQPNKIAEQLIADRKQNWTEANLSFPAFIRATLAIISLTFFNVVFIITPFTGIAAIVLGIWGICLTLVLTPLAYTAIVLFNIRVSQFGNVYMFMQAFEFPTHIQQSLIRVSGFMSLVLCGIGLLGCIMLFYLSRWLVRIFMTYIKTNTSIVRGSIQQ